MGERAGSLGIERVLDVVEETCLQLLFGTRMGLNMFYTTASEFVHKITIKIEY